MSSEQSGTQALALLGRQDQPTDAVRDYCYWLGQALARRGVTLTAAEVPWDEQGWARALLKLWRKGAAWKATTIFVQYTALSWSRHGFPFGLIAVVLLLKCRHVRCVMVFHDAPVQVGRRLIDRIRHACQRLVMRLAYGLAVRAVFTLPAARIPWLAARSDKVAFIPVGANIPDPGISTDDRLRVPDGRMSVAVFGVTGGSGIGPEVADIAHAVRESKKKIPDLRLVVLGRNSIESRQAFLEALDAAGVEINTLGLLPPDEVARTLSAADALLFVRGSISTRRGSAIAGIVCGLPIVAYAGLETDFPITEAGIEPVPEGNREALADALTRVLTQENLRRELRRKSLEARDRYFSWDRIAECYLAVLNNA